MKKIKAQRWSFKDRKYYPYEIPYDTCLYTEDMDTDIQCANCGRWIKYGDTYTSRVIHTGLGLGFPVCEECYKAELAMEKKYNQRKFNS